MVLDIIYTSFDMDINLKL